jgi:sulfite reductase (ferredoxin)
MAKRGSLENPELVDVPGAWIPILEQEFDDFETEATKFLGGETPEDEFIKFRLRQGVYGQRQAGVQMVRVKLPVGGVTPEQLECFAHIAETYAPLNKGHVTTRQNIQYHHIPLAQMADVLRDLAEAGLSSREGCGNTVRNVTGDPWAGILEGEVFDVTPYAGAYVRYFVRHPTTQLMPRKVKTAFEGTPSADRSITRIHDIAFIAKERDGVRGFEVVVGGGTSIMPRVAPTLYDFVEAENGEYLEVAEAVFRIFDRQDWLRVNRARARLKVFVDKFGIDELRAQVEAERADGSWEKPGAAQVAELRVDIDEEAAAPEAPAFTESPNGDAAAFDKFFASNVVRQRQAGFSAVQVRIPRGDLSPEQFRGLAQLSREFSGGWMRTTVHQNLLFRWVRDESVYALWRRLGELGLDGHGVDQVLDVVSCPGTDSCKLGITSSMGLNKAVQDRIVEMAIEDERTKRIHIKMSGCPNGCSQHHIANIGFYGASIKAGEHTIPAYVAHMGGVFEGGEVVYGTRLKVRLPAKRVPDAVERWIRLYEAERTGDEEFNDTFARLGAKRYEDEVKDLALPVEFGLESMGMFMDWGKKVPFQVVRGEGECAV